jgi:predicted O-linked N-acetylglucosamine transferase (SPINDLY family)
MHHEPRGSSFPPDFAAGVRGCHDAYRKNPNDVAALACLRRARLEVANICLATTPERLQASFAGGLGQILQMVYESDMSCEPMLPQEAELCDRLKRYLAGHFQERDATNHLLASMMYLRADQLSLAYEKENVPLWFFPIFVRFLVAPPKFFRRHEEIHEYREHLRRTLDFFAGITVRGDHRFAGNPALVAQVNNLVLADLPLHPVYFDDGDLKELFVSRAKLLEQALRGSGYAVDHRPPARRTGGKIRLGILNVHFCPQTETFATIPVFERLDRERFEVYLYALQEGNHPLEGFVRECADRYFHLVGDLPGQIETLRSHDLDILFIGSNVTAGTGPLAAIASHRIAPAQVTSICSPVTTGMRNVDYYIAGELALAPERAAEQYSERLVTVPGSGFCFRYPGEVQAPSARFGREQLGIQDDAVVFVSGANFFKIVPALRRSWAEIVASVPGSVLLLYPFNPYWAGTYPAGKQLLDELRAMFRQYGVAGNRLVVHRPLPQRADVKELLKIADVYLDAHPYSGATSLIDPFEVGLPVVAKDGAFLRFRQAGALLRELGLDEWVTGTEERYRELAVALGRDAVYRGRFRNEIVERMSRGPAFLDADAAGAKMGEAFERIFAAIPNSRNG